MSSLRPSTFVHLLSIMVSWRGCGLTETGQSFSASSRLTIPTNIRSLLSLGVLWGHASLPTQCWNGPLGCVIFQWARICVASLGKWCLSMSESQYGFLSLSPLLPCLDPKGDCLLYSNPETYFFTTSKKMLVILTSDLALFTFLTHTVTMHRCDYTNFSSPLKWPFFTADVTNPSYIKTPPPNHLSGDLAIQ